MSKLDVKYIHLHVPIAKKFRQSLAFSHQGRLFLLNALPFGLTSAPYVFTRAMAYPSKLLGQENHFIIGYLDDWVNRPNLFGFLAPCS